jgi:chromosome segregation ATPase
MLDKKIMIALGLIIVFAAAIVFTLTLGAQERKRLNQEIANLQEEKKGLDAKLQDIERQSKGFVDRVASLNRDLERLSQEKREVQDKYDSVLEDKERLATEVSALNAQLLAAKKESSYSPPLQVKIEQPAPQPTKGQDEAYWADLLKKKTELELQLESASSELKTVKLNNNQLESEISNLNRDNGDLKEEIAHNQKMVDKLTLEITREKNDKYQIEASLKDLESENKSLKTQLKTVSGRRIELEKDVVDLESKNSELDNSLTKMEAFVKQKLLQIDGLMEDLDINQKDSEQRQKQVQEKQLQPEQVREKPESAEPKRGSVQLQPIIVRPQEGRFRKEASARKASVLLINKENNFAIINLGEAAGIKIGDSFRIYNSRQEVIANLEVISVRQNISACDIKPQNAPIAVGDSVNFK